MREVDQPAEFQRVHQNLPALLGDAGEGHARAVGRNVRRQRDVAQMRELLLIGAVVIHLPDFFRAAAAADEVELGFGDAVDAAAQAEDDLVGEAMRDQARVGVVGLFAILLAQHLRRLRILGVVEPALHIERSALDTEVAEGQHVGIGRRAAPIRQVHLLRSTRDRQRIEALRDHVEDSRRLQIVRQGGVEGHRQVLRAACRW